MSISQTVDRFLKEKDVNYQIRHHHHTGSTLESAYSAHVPSHQIAKGVLLRDDQGYVLAVLPGDRNLDLETLRYATERPLALASEEELSDVFDDCAVGAVPAIGPAYGLETLVDERLLEETGLYFEGGGHKELVYVEKPEFMKLMESATYWNLSSGIDE